MLFSEGNPFSQEYQVIQLKKEQIRRLEEEIKNKDAEIKKLNATIEKMKSVVGTCLVFIAHSAVECRTAKKISKIRG